MRWARFERDGQSSYGTVEGNSIQPVSGSPFDRWERTGAPVPLSTMKLLVPLMPCTFYACGLNYEEHIRAVAEKIGQSREPANAAGRGISSQ